MCGNQIVINLKMKRMLPCITGVMSLPHLCSGLKNVQRKEMSMKLDLGKIFFLILFLTLSVMAATAGTIKGTITDRQTKEPLTGATVQVSGTAQGAVADLDGNYTLELKNGTYTLTVRYIGYKDMTINAVEIKGETVLNFDMEPDTQTLGEVQVTAKKNLEGERALQMERQKATLAIENLGSKEMSLKGIGNVEEGVKKITGISIASAGQLIVRGLGDRYSTTTLNGLPIASPNPDNKLVPLDLFPSSTVQNITVSKVYDAAAFADYSGAHINISTKENIPQDFFQLSLNTGGKFNTLGKDRYQMDRSGSLLKTPGVDAAALGMPLMEFDKYVKTRNIFETSFSRRQEEFVARTGREPRLRQELRYRQPDTQPARLLQRQQRLPKHGRCLLQDTRGHRHRAGRLLLRQLCAGTEARRPRLPGLHPAPERPHRLHFLLRPQRHRHLPAPRRY